MDIGSRLSSVAELAVAIRNAVAEARAEGQSEIADELEEILTSLQTDGPGSQ